ncbi:hypothetical protein F383_30261 [Gossypium arboreum]|uniref:Uncharacterized protein n=1 Tax=Gossypium arboreum TaxID=29729 RepID=A0A0B0PA92_GOSAR|nr:hypothetical protein F383_30261 [Gossypium arboreum]
MCASKTTFYTLSSYMCASKTLSVTVASICGYM